MAKKDDAQFPHNGTYIMKAVDAERRTYSEIAERMNVHPTSFQQYRGRYSLQMSIWWRLSRALNRNLIAEIGDLLGIPYETRSEKACRLELENTRAELAKTKAELEKAKVQIEVYKSIVKK
ncbi:MAG TPA: hypothetical protein DEF88_04350 [Porphyromonadaceae bacterium]|jgi:hypothetical protein|nr:hypothetical protein [Porphyromonadaceae bacterium]HBX19662.1 hypothetical protein [Porphyromonadaceae bacterium]HCM20935.1 hypothetical protein [Porphyromonadaceae bacterium]